MDYEGNKQVMMQLTPHQRAEKKAHEKFATANHTFENENFVAAHHCEDEKIVANTILKGGNFVTKPLIIRP